MAAPLRTANALIITAPGKAAHLATARGVTACNGRSLGFAMPAPATEKLCRSCSAGLRSGRIATTPELADELTLAALGPLIPRSDDNPRKDDMTDPRTLELQQLEEHAQAKMAEARTAYLVGARAGQGQLFTAQELRTGTPRLEAAGQGSLFEVIR